MHSMKPADLSQDAWRVSVVIPAFNAAEHLGLAISTVLDQTRKVDEIIVVDDGSTDNTRNVVARYADEGVRYEWQPNQGSAAARNKGIISSSGNLIAFLDSDDCWLPRKIEQQLQLFEASPDLILVSGDQIFWDCERSLRKVRRFSDNGKGVNYKTEIIYENLIGNPSMVMVKRSAFDQSGLFDTAIRFGDDWEMWIRLVALGDVAFVPEPVAVYRWHKESLSQHNKKACLASYRRICRRGISQTVPPLLRPLAMVRVIKHSEFLYNYRAARGYVGSWMRRLTKPSDTSKELVS